MNDEFDIKITQTINEINILLSKESSHTLPHYITRNQLQDIVRELTLMNKIRNANEFYPYYPKGISDCWDYNDFLSRQLMDILNYYLSIYPFEK